MGTAIRPHIPTTPCTEMAPTGSSTRSLSMVTMAKTTITPPMAPIMVASKGEGVSGSAVMATRPARAPLRAIVRSALPNNSRAVIRPKMVPPAADMLVLTKTAATALASSILEMTSCEPPLNPNQPSQRIKVPSVAIGIFAPGMALMEPSLPYLPLRAPSRRTPASAAEAPARCTTPEPAKSRKPSSSRNPPPHFQ